MKKALNALTGVFLLILAGCYFGDQVAPRIKTISLDFPPPAGRDNADVSVNDAQVQEALQIIGTVFAGAGLTRDANPPDVNNSGFIVSYSKYSGEGLRFVDRSIDMYLKGHQLEVIFTERPNRGSHLRESTRKICNSLRKKLNARYGAERVKKLNDPRDVAGF
jgi:hypothetical protein